MTTKETFHNVFIGSSTEELKLARYLHDSLRRLKTRSGRGYQCRVWDQGVFQAGRTTIASLESAARMSNFAVMVFSPDDIVLKKRTRLSYVPRDNVLFELGLFTGSLGQERTYLVFCKDDKVDILSDLSGVTFIPYDSPDDDTSAALQSAIMPVALRINEAVEAVEADQAAKKPDSLSANTDCEQILSDIIARDNSNIQESDLVRFQQLGCISPQVYSKLRRKLSNKRRKK